ncbi:MAG: prepilin-type N-terminal cleavage/methylation domain-containing protein [Nitrospira sp.]|nr:prepilin-type N-terminal cleavage/methylation domain-containing protein [Nitrospira sp.]
MVHVPLHPRQQGFTIIELMIAVTIIGALAGLAIPNYLGYLDKARLARCIAEIRSIERVVDSYEAAFDSLPNSLDEAGAGDMVDPWGNPYEYLNIAALTLPGGGGNGNGGGNAGGNGGGGGNGNGNSGGNSGGGKKTSYWFEPDSAYAGQGGGNASKGKPRKERFLHPINSDYDLYSMGKDGESVEPLTAKKSQDDVIRANDGSFVGLAAEF